MSDALKCDRCKNYGESSVGDKGWSQTAQVYSGNSNPFDLKETIPPGDYCSNCTNEIRDAFKKGKVK